MLKKSILLLSVLYFTSCAELQTMVNEYATEQNAPLTSFDVSQGLKEALQLGSKHASQVLSIKDGFYKDELVKILLPPEAQTISQNIKKIPGGEDMIDKVVLRLNRAAEDAVVEAAPIFASAITEMTIQDAFGILKGDKNAATQYLKAKSYSKLKDLFMPKIKASLDKKLIANLSTNESWNLLTKSYNQVASSFIGQLADLETVNSGLDEYVTDKALDALFIKVAEEELKIRNDPAERVSSILKRVFSQQDD
ncbi:DUF4197 domain-containing protein [Ancylomarina sp. 16SWW S1-10-2]|uniref:DUF4197 domain-containing protein n=1 Tax=Ancylomarina sp. 16SWW S1-10-2 TaxID=2499681 RepID=UPI0012AE4071|nr:DUF4197 domain-containing protein [Ancylomarina sp. 16SWW S1-10-2]MRT92349.1 DUF4197 domain-containing protein [Ancylomarina sp. 16SWW S1-10-2]